MRNGPRRNQAGIRILRNLCDEANESLQQEEAVHEDGSLAAHYRPLILVDDYDPPWSKKSNAQVNESHERRNNALVQTIRDIKDIFIESSAQRYNALIKSVQGILPAFKG